MEKEKEPCKKQDLHYCNLFFKHRTYFTKVCQRDDGKTTSAANALTATPVQPKLQHSAADSAPKLQHSAADMKSYSSVLGLLVYICTDYFNQYTILIFNHKFSFS